MLYFCVMQETINNSKNKTAFFITKYKKKYVNNLDFTEFEYINAHHKSLVKTKYGLCKIKPSKLLEGCIPSIQSAIDKNLYFINQAKEVWGNKFDYSKLEYVSMHKKVIITCPIHNNFFISPVNHLYSKTGCGKCGFISTNEANKKDPTGWSYTQWSNRANTSKNFDSFKLYILECKNVDTNEIFYKIGKTYVTIKKRIRSISRFPYFYEILIEFKNNSETISILEKALQKQNKKYSYLPKIKFDGMYECFNNLTEETWNFIKNKNIPMEIFI